MAVATRARVSSQAWKRAIRKMFAEEMADMVETGKRTLKATDLVAGELAALAPELDDARLKKDAKKALENDRNQTERMTTTPPCSF